MEASESTILRLSGWMLWPLLVVSPASGAEDEAPPRLDPVEITVTAPRLATPLADLPAAVSRVDERQATEGRQGLQLDEALNRVPGLFAQNRYNFAQDARISIRGFGSRAPFGVRGLRILQDGIPETTPDGQSQVDAIDLLNLRDIEVLRGPSAALYGNASGGVIAARTRDGRDPRGFGGGVQMGSYGYRRAEAVAEEDHGAHRYSLTAHDFAIDGYRDQSTAEKRYLRLHTASELEAGTLNFHLRYLDAPRTDDPGGLTREEMREDRRAAAPLAAALNSTQSAEQLTTGLQWEQPLAGGELRLGGFWTQRDYEQQLPFPGASRVAYERDFYGVNAQYERDFGRTRVLTGVDLEEQRDDRTRLCSAGRLFDRAALECSEEPDEPMTDLALDQREQARSRGVFVQTDTALGSDWNLALGARHDRVRMSVDDHFSDRVGQSDRSDSRTFEETSAMAGLIWHFWPEYRAYVNVATNFETPTFTEFARKDGAGFNPDLDPQRARSLEVGIRRETGRLAWEASAYAARVQDEIVVDDEGDFRDFYENAGRTAREGVELGVEWRASEAWTLSSALSLNRFRFREYSDAGGERFDGNRMPGLPREQLFVEADWRDGPWFVTVDALHVGSRYADNANTEKVGSQTTLNLRAGRYWQQGGTRAEAFVAANNLLDADNVDNIRINAAGGRYYEPAPGLTLMAGVRMYFGQ